ncbi:MAG: hypothetical protein WC516_05200 [Patescibacteria group bacterium]|jgi:hypothetical protein
MKILEIRKNVRTDKVEGHREVTVTDVDILHPSILDLASWIKCGRLNSKFSLTTSTYKYMYVRLEDYTEEDIERLAH